MCIRVMIADDHCMMREGIKSLLEFDNSIKVVEEANDGIECLDILKKLNAEKNLPDVLLLDINMPNKNGIEVLKELKDLFINIKVIFLTVHNEVNYLMKAMDIGADGYVLKDSDSAELKKAISRVMKGSSYIQPALITAFNSELVKRDADTEKINELTDRELEVLKLVAGGSINKEIASILDISERTVKNHVSNIFKKIGVTDRTQAAVFAIKNELINL